MASERSRSFGAVAAAYEKYRPEYPDLLAQLILEYAETPLRTALELGAGTGKATRVLARHGIAVTASDPDDAMLRQLAARVPGTATVTATLETLPQLGTFDLVYAAAALHWTEPTGRWDRIARLLGPGGVFANFGGAPYLSDPELEEAMEDAQRPWLVDDSPGGTVRSSIDGIRWPASELVSDPRFTDVRETTIEQRFELMASDWTGYLSTVSAYLVLDEGDRTAALDAIAAVLPDVVEVRADLTLHLARRVGAPQIA